MPADILRKILEIPGPFMVRPVGGGSINDTGLSRMRLSECNAFSDKHFMIDLRSERRCRSFVVLTKNGRSWFCKLNNTGDFPEFFVKEAKGLALLGDLGPLRVPEALANTEIDGRQVLVLEWIDQGPRTEAFWRLPCLPGCATYPPC